VTERVVSFFLRVSQISHRRTEELLLILRLLSSSCLRRLEILRLMAVFRASLVPEP
jgi:hypothetical protein